MKCGLHSQLCVAVHLILLPGNPAQSQMTILNLQNDHIRFADDLTYSQPKGGGPGRNEVLYT